MGHERLILFVQGSLTHPYYKLMVTTVPVVLRVFVSCMWFGMQAFWGGQATRVMIGAIIPGKILKFSLPYPLNTNISRICPYA
jgi:cytosine/uracil/thiamine/allantoin permease